MKLRRLGAIVLKELRQLRRDRLTFGMIVGIPILQLALFGYAINLDVRKLDAAVLDQANTARSREFTQLLAHAQVLTLRERLHTPQEVYARLGSGHISAALIIPPDFETRLERRDRPPAQIVVDGSDQAVQAAVRQLVNAPLPGAGPAPPGIAVVNFYNPQRRAPLNTVPGLIGVILTMTMVLFTASALVRERERGNLEMLIATPVSPWELTLGKLLPFIGIGLLQVTVVLGLGWWLFDVPIRGSGLDLYLAALVFILASLALGVLLSTLARSQFQALQMAIFTFLPQILLSGFMFPYAAMPRPAQWIAEGLPLTHFLRLVRGIMLRGVSITTLWEPLLALLLFTAIALTLAVTRVRKRLD